MQRPSVTQRCVCETGGTTSARWTSKTLARARDRIEQVINGAKPADLPIERADKFEFVVNRKTAKAIGVELPTAILLRADEVIE
jgi:ABC-type uncharacterized transport system substrate-binding protein